MRSSSSASPGVDEVQAAAGDGGHQLAARRDGAPAAAGGGRGGQAATAIYAEFSPAENQGQSRGELVAAETARVNDFWDGTGSRQRRFVELLRARHPRAEVRNLNPILDEMRSVKSAREIAHGPARLADRRPRPDGSDAQHRTGRHRIPARRRGALRLPR